MQYKPIEQDNLNQEFEPAIKKRVQDKKERLDQDLLESLIIVRDFDQIFLLAEKQPKTYREYNKIKYKNINYQIGDSVMVSYFKNNQKVEQIGKLKRIISVKSFVDDSQLPLVLVNWYCNRDDLPQSYQDEFLQSMSLYELFLTELQSVLFIDSLMYICKVFSFEEYEEQLGSTDERVYFMRSTYNSIQEILTPSPKDWTYQCFCKKPPNPDLTYVFCEKCQKWIHLNCAGLSQEEANEIDFYICKQCNNDIQ